MDRNSIVGIILIVLIMIAWPFYAKLVAPEESPAHNVPSLSDTTRSAVVHADTTRQQSVTKVATSRQANADTNRRYVSPEKQVSLSTDLYHAVISTHGLSFRRWDLKKFQDFAESPVEAIDTARNLNIQFARAGKEFNSSDLEWTLDGPDTVLACSGSEERQLRFFANVDSASRVWIEFKIRGNRYDMGMDVRLENFTEALTEYQVQWLNGLRPIEKNISEELTYQRGYTYLGDDKEEYDLSDEQPVSFTGMTKWIGVRNKYFVLFLIPQQADGISSTFAGTTTLSGDVPIDKKISIGLGMKHRSNATDQFLLYHGPTDYSVLKTYDENLNVILEWGWAIFRPFTKGIFYTFNFLYEYIPNYGIVIIVFAFLVKLLLYPLTQKSYVGMQKMKEVMPRQKALQEKYKGNPQKMQQEMMKLYKEVGYNPLSGCLPMVIQIPILFPIYQVFRESFDLRQASFFGWIDDLSLPDTIFTAHTGLPLIGDFNINPLPILMTILTFVQQAVAPMTPMMDGGDPAQRFNQKFMKWGMPVLFFFLFNNFSSGLVLYWTVFNVLTMLQQLYLIPKSTKSA